MPIGRVHDRGGDAQSGISPASIEVLTKKDVSFRLCMPRIRTFLPFDNRQDLSPGTFVRFDIKHDQGDIKEAVSVTKDKSIIGLLIINFVLIALVLVGISFLIDTLMANTEWVLKVRIVEFFVALFFIWVVIFWAGCRSFLRGLLTGLILGIFFMLLLGLYDLANGSVDDMVAAVGGHYMTLVKVLIAAGVAGFWFGSEEGGFQL